jgi:hypothetical protein
MDEETAKKTILEKPEIFSRAFSLLVKKIAQVITPADANYEAYQELSSYEMPPDFMTWYYTDSNDPKFAKFDMFRKLADKISAMEVISMRRQIPVDPFSVSQKGGRKRCRRTQRRSRVRRQKRRTNRRH